MIVAFKIWLSAGVILIPLGFIGMATAGHQLNDFMLKVYRLLIMVWVSFALVGGVYWIWTI